MNNLKKYLVLLLIAVLSLSFAACGEDDSGTNAPGIIEDMVKDSNDATDYSDFFGTWTANDNNGYDYIEIYRDNDETRFEITHGEDLAASGYLQYMTEYGYVYAYNEHDGKGYRCSFDLNNALNIDSFGVFNLSGDKKSGGNGTQSGDFGFTGAWLLDGDTDADSTIEIDADGNWVLYERQGYGGELEPVDRGSMSYTEDDGEIYFADSSEFSDIAYQVTKADDNTIYWGGENDCYIRSE